MKIKGSSKIISNKEAQESLVSAAEAVDLIHPEVESSEPKKKKQTVVPNVIEGTTGLTKAQKAKKAAKDLIEKSKPFRDKQVLLAKEFIEKTKPFRDKQKIAAIEAVKKVRGWSPYVDKSIVAMDKSINYITKPEETGRSEVVQNTRAPSVFGIWVMFITFGVFMMWAILAPLDSASDAMGKIVLNSQKRIIQHPDGGVIKEILVQEGDIVKKGQTLILLDDTQVRAKRNQEQLQYLSFLAETVRLIAERDELAEINIPQELLNHTGDPEVQKFINNQNKVFSAKKAAIASKTLHAEQTTVQLTEQKNALLPQIESTEELIRINTEQVNSYKKLFAQGNIQKQYLQDAEAKKAEYQGRKGALLSQLAETEQKIIQSKVALEAEKNANFEKTVQELKESQARLSVSAESLKIYEESLRRTVILSPEDGNISNINEILTPQGVLPQQQPLMEVIPQEDKLIVEAKIKAQDIAIVKVGQIARVRLTAFRTRTTPVLEGVVVALSADAIMPTTQLDMQAFNGQPYYKARIEIDKEKFDKIAKLKNIWLYPGMNVQVMIVIGTRTMMKYLLDPITMTMEKSFIEN
jgi:HlyD family secretion protein